MRKKSNWEKFLQKDFGLALEFHQKTSINKFSFSRKKWPSSWIRIHFKSYSRLKNISLSNAEIFSGELSKAILNRKSQRSFSSYSITEKEISNLLFFSSGIITQTITDWDKTTRAYPSAGARYPLEVYAVILNSRDFPRGLYHYNVQSHSLELLLAGGLKKVLTDAIGQNNIRKSSVVFIITSILSRSKIKYGDRSYRHSLLEAGHIGQNITLIATALNLKNCPIGGFKDDKIAKLLDIDLEQEFPLYLIAVGK